MVKFRNYIRYCWVLDIGESLIMQNLIVLLILLNNLKAFNNIVEILTNFLNFWSILIGVTDKRLRKCLLRLLRCVWGAGNIYWWLIISFLHFFKSLQIISWAYLITRLHNDTTKCILVNVLFVIAFASGFRGAVLDRMHVVVV